MRLIRGLRLFLYLLCTVVLLGLLAIGGLFLLERQWGEMVVERVLDQVNQELHIPVKTSGVDFTFFADFPHASIRLRDVRVSSLRAGGEDGVAAGEELLRAGSLLLVLNPFDLLREEYRVEALRVEDGALRLEEYADGGNNYTLEARAKDSTSGADSWAIEGFELEDMMATYLDGRSGLRVGVRLASLEANARYEGEALGLRLRGKGVLEELVHQGKAYAKGEELRLDTELRYDSLTVESPRSSLEVRRRLRHLLCFPKLQARAEKWQLGGPGRPDPEHAVLPGSQRRVAGTRGAAGEPPLTQSRRPSGPPAPSHRPHCGQLAARRGVARGPAAAPGTRQRRPCTRGRRSATLLERTGAEMRA